MSTSRACLGTWDPSVYAPTWKFIGPNKNAGFYFKFKKKYGHITNSLPKKCCFREIVSISALKKIMVTSQIPYQKMLFPGNCFYFSPFKNYGGRHKFPTKKTLLPKEMCVFFFLIGVFVCCYLFQTWVISQWWTLKPNQTPFFWGKTRFFCLLLVDGVFIQTASICDHRAVWLTASEEIPSLWQKALGSSCLGLKHQGKLQVP